MLKRIIILSFLLVSSATAAEVNIYDHKFPVDNIDFLDNEFVNISLEKNGNELIRKDNLNYYVIKNLISKLPLDEFYKICDNNCLIDIFQNAFNKNQYNVASLAYLMFVNNCDDPKLIEKHNLFLFEQREEISLKFFKQFFEEKIPNKILKSNAVNQELSKALLFVTLHDSNFDSSQALEFLLKNEDNIILEFDNLINDYCLRDDPLKNISKIVNLEEKILGFSNKYYQKTLSDLNRTKIILNEIKGISSADSLLNISLLFYKNLKFFEIIQKTFIEKVYDLVDKSLNEKKYVEALNLLFLIPENKITERVIDTLKVIFDNAGYEDSLLKDVNLNNLTNILKNNIWLRNLVVNFQENHVKYLINNWNINKIITEFEVLLKLRPDTNMRNDRIRVLIAWEALKHGEKDFSNDVLSNIGHNSVFLLSPKGWFLFCKRFLWIFFTVISITILGYVLNIKLVKKYQKTIRFQNSKKSSTQTDSEQDSAEKKEYIQLLKFFGLTKDDVTLNEIKSIYRKKIKKIHPDILGKETEEFLRVQEKYKELLKLHQRFSK